MNNINESNKSTHRSAEKQKRRMLILEAACECFVENGFHQTSIRDIANKAGVSLGNVYNHFADKASLIAEVRLLEAQELQIFEAILNQNHAPIIVIHAFAEAYLTYIAQPVNAMLTAEITAEGIRNPEIRAGFIENRQRLTEQVLSVISKGVVLKQFDPQVNNIQMAEQLLNLIEGVAIRSAFVGENVSQTDKANIKILIQKFLMLPPD